MVRLAGVQEGTVREIGVCEAKNRLGTLLDWVEHGEEIVITRRGKPVARLVPGGPAADHERAGAAARRIREMSKGMTLRGTPIRSLIDEGRV